MLGVGVSEKTYVDDVFSTYIYTGTGSTRSINNGINLSAEGGMTWIKSRSNARPSAVFDTVRGANKYLQTNSNFAETTTVTDMLTAFNDNGFSLGADAGSSNVNANNYTQASWTFRKAKGFFDVVTYTGNGTAGRTISHNLGCVPGMIVIKNTSSAYDWATYHCEVANTKALFLNHIDSQSGDSATYWNNTSPTSTEFTLGSSGHVNLNGDSYVAYLFGGGASTSDNAVSFDGTDDRLTLANSSDFNFGTGDFTIEGWFNKSSAATTGFFQLSDNTGGLKDSSSDSIALRYKGADIGAAHIQLIYNDTNISASYSYTPSKYCHFAVCRQGSTIKVFVDGVELISQSDSKDYDFGNLCIGGFWDTSYMMNGKITNFRIVKGQALYTQAFTPPTEVFTTSSRDAESSKVKLICCNGSTTTAATVAPGTITAVGNPTVASSESIFDDTSANVFGDAGDQNVIKCGSYVGNGSATAGPEINLGWEAQYILIKNIDSSADWVVLDSMRGIVTSGEDMDKMLQPNLSDDEFNGNFVNLTSTGFKILDANAMVNTDGDNYTYMAIRRPDGYVGKPADAGTSVFDIAYGVDSSANPTYPSSILTDFNIYKKPAASSSWYVNSRLMQGMAGLIADGNSTESANNGVMFDYQTGMGSWGADNSAWLSWHWKRHAGFDVVTYKGNGVGGTGRQIPHGMNRAPEMIITKARNLSYEWPVWHTGLSAIGNNLRLNASYDELGPNNSIYGGSGNALPTATHWTVGNSSLVNTDGERYISFLFSSVEKISAVGSYTGNGTSSSSTQTITTGFQPRFVLIKSSSNDEHWVVFDTTRGWSSGSSDQLLELNNSDAQYAAGDIGHPISTGFVLKNQSALINLNNVEYVYYAHA